jgi:hypothetical protein
MGTTIYAMDNYGRIAAMKTKVKTGLGKFDCPGL